MRRPGNERLIGPLCPKPFLIWSLLTPPVHEVSNPVQTKGGHSGLLKTGTASINLEKGKTEGDS